MPNLPPATGWVDCKRVQPLMRAHIDKYNYTFQNDKPIGGQRVLVAHTGLSARLIYDVMEGRRARIEVSNLDKLLTGIDQEYLANWSEEEGGFADVYDEMGPKIKRKAYPSDKKKKHDKKVKCACGGMKHYRSDNCNACYRASKNAVARKCLNCKKVLQGGRRKGQSIRCMPCWEKFRKTDKEARKGYVARKDGIARVLKRRIVADDTDA